MDPVGIRSTAGRRRGLELVTLICVAFAVTAVAAVAATAPKGAVLDYAKYVGGRRRPHACRDPTGSPR